MNTNKNIWLAALGGAVIAGLTAALWRSEKKERFPLSPVNDLEQLPKKDPAPTSRGQESNLEMKEVTQQS